MWSNGERAPLNKSSLRLVKVTEGMNLEGNYGKQYLPR